MSNQNKKVAQMAGNGAVKMSTDSKMPNEMSEMEKQKFMNEPVTRQEVSNFVDGFINNEVVPQILNTVGKELFALRSMNTVLQKFIIDAGICTEDQFVETYEAYMKEQTEKLKKQQEEMARKQRLQSNGIIVPDKTIIH